MQATKDDAEADAEEGPGEVSDSDGASAAGDVVESQCGSDQDEDEDGLVVDEEASDFEGPVASPDGDVPLEDGDAASQDCEAEPEKEEESSSEHGTASADTLRMGSPIRRRRVEVPRFSPTDDVFESPFAGNSGPARREVTEMCMGLMQYLSDVHPHILKSLRLQALGS